MEKYGRNVRLISYKVSENRCTLNAVGQNPKIGGRKMHRPVVNITSSERAGRMAIGLLAVVTGVLLLLAADSSLALILELLLVAAGLDLLLTGALGHCPLYAKLGHVPTSLRGRS